MIVGRGVVRKIPTIVELIVGVRRKSLTVYLPTNSRRCVGNNSVGSVKECVVKILAVG